MTLETTTNRGIVQRQAMAGALSIPSTFGEYAPLSRYTGEPTELPATPDWIATISAGKRGEPRDGKPGLPAMSRDGRIELHDPDGRAPGLALALAATDYKKLVIAFVSNSLGDVIQERIVGYSSSALKFHGDAESITELTLRGRVVHLAGTPGYAAALAQCTVSRRVFFTLARWDDLGADQPPAERWVPRVLFLDGLGVYSIRTTSARSTANIAATLALIGRQTGGAVAGLPFALSLSTRQVADPNGMQRTVSLWSMVFSPPEPLQLTSGTFRMLAERSLEQGRQLVLPSAPRPESIEDAAYEGSFTAVDDGPVVCNPDVADLALMQRGAPADGPASRRRWFAIAKGSRFGTDEGRADFLSAWTDGNYDSLALWLKQATQHEVDTCLDVLERCMECVPPLLPRAWEGLDVEETPEVAPDSPGDFQAAVDAARAAQRRPQTVDRETGEITDPEPEPVPAFAAEDDPANQERLAFLQELGRRFNAATEPHEVRELHAEYTALWAQFTDDEKSAIKGWERAAVERVRPKVAGPTAEEIDGFEQLRQETAARNREAIDASRR